MEQTVQPPASIPTIRRPRAGTMPSFIQPEMNRRTTNSSAALLLTTIENGRHRSGSLNLPPVDASFWALRHDGPLSPSSEQLLQNDSDFSIARTMRSLGLEEDNDKVQQQQQQQQSNGLINNSLFHHQSPPEFHMPSRSLLSGNNRNRSYSVNATARYDAEITGNNSGLSRTNSLTQPTSNNTLGYASPLEGFTRQQNRPRASSMGRADAGRLSSNILPPPAALWSNGGVGGIQQRSSPLVSMTEESDYDNSLSLGDSELLANMLHDNNHNNNVSNNAVFDQHSVMNNVSMSEVSHFLEKLENIPNC